MQYLTHEASGIIHAAAGRPERVALEGARWRWQGRGACGSRVLGFSGHVAYREFVTCERCRRSLIYREG